MADPETGEVEWYSPDPRAIVPIDVAPGEPGGVRVPRSLRSVLKRGRFEITTDRVFEEVIRACAEPRENDGGWINAEIIKVYTLLHRAGHAHSVEAWVTGGETATGEAGGSADSGASAVTTRRLVGGLYGVHVGGAFFGESMFCRPDLGGTDASKVCFVRLVEHLRARGFALLDTQFANPHMERLGIVEVPRREYLQRLRAAVEKSAEWGAWSAG